MIFSYPLKLIVDPTPHYTIIHLLIVIPFKFLHIHLLTILFDNFFLFQILTKSSFKFINYNYQLVNYLNRQINSIKMNLKNLYQHNQFQLILIMNLKIIKLKQIYDLCLNIMIAIFYNLQLLNFLMFYFFIFFDSNRLNSNHKENSNFLYLILQGNQ